MPKFALDINGIKEGAAEGRKEWEGEIPPTGTYEGILKVVQIQRISDEAPIPANRGKPKLNIGVELRNTPEGKYDGYLTWNNLNLVESSIPYVNQFLMALTDGSDLQFEEIKKKFYAGFDTDERQQHVTGIGKWNINSPEGTIPILVSCKKRGYVPKGSNETVFITDIKSFLVGGGGGGVKVTNPAGPETSDVVEEEAQIALDTEEESAEPEAEPDADGASVFGTEEEPANA